MTSQSVFMVHTNYITSTRLVGIFNKLVSPPCLQLQRVCGAVHINPGLKPSLNEPGRERQMVLLKNIDCNC